MDFILFFFFFENPKRINIYIKLIIHNTLKKLVYKLCLKKPV
jgi:hypothetical protein